MKKTLLILSIFAQSCLADEATNIDVGVKLGRQFGYGVGEHYFNNFEFDKIKPLKKLTTIVKGEDAYELSISPERVFKIQSSPTSKRKISLKFKLLQAADTYLVDIAYLDINDIIIAITNSPYGYHFIKFKLVNNSYVPYLYAANYFVPGLVETEPNKAKEVGFNVDGSFFVKRDDNSVDKYTIPENQEFMLRNNQRFNFSSISRYDDALPAHLQTK